MEKKNVAKVYGKVTKLPKNTNALKFLENIKIPKNKMWYVLVEKQDNELHMIRHNQEGVNANIFVQQVTDFYKKNANENDKILLNSIKIEGNDGFSVIKNIPEITVKITNNEGNIVEKKLINKITEDLIKLLR